MIGEFAINTLYKRGYNVFAISMEDIMRQHEKENIELDFVDFLLPELKNFARIFLKQDLNKVFSLRLGFNYKIDIEGKELNWISHLYRMFKNELEEVVKWIK